MSLLLEGSIVLILLTSNWITKDSLRPDVQLTRKATGNSINCTKLQGPSVSTVNCARLNFICYVWQWNISLEYNSSSLHPCPVELAFASASASASVASTGVYAYRRHKLPLVLTFTSTFTSSSSLMPVLWRLNIQRKVSPEVASFTLVWCVFFTHQTPSVFSAGLILLSDKTRNSAQWTILSFFSLLSTLFASSPLLLASHY